MVQNLGDMLELLLDARSSFWREDVEEQAWTSSESLVAWLGLAVIGEYQMDSGSPSCRKKKLMVSGA